MRKGRKSWIVGVMLAAAMSLSFAASVAADTEKAGRAFRLGRLPIHTVWTGWGVPKWDKSLVGRALSIRGREFGHGLGTHAPSKLAIDLHGDAIKFTAKVGVDDTAANSDEGSVEFVVWGDGKPLWKSGLMTAQQPARDVEVDLTGVTELTLEVTEGGNGNGHDHADWAEATLWLSGEQAQEPVAVWREGDEVIKAIKELRAFAKGRLKLDQKEVMDRIRMIERVYGKLAAGPGDTLVRPVLDSLLETGDVPGALREDAAVDADQGRREIRLEDLGTAGWISGWGQAQEGKSVTEKPLKIAGVPFARGIGTHARSRLELQVFGAAEEFTAQVGIDDGAREPVGSVEFLVLADGRELWRSGVMKSGDPAREVKVSLHGAQRLVLEATDGGDGITRDHADWAEAKLVVSGRRPEVIFPAVEAEKRWAKIGWVRPLDRLALSWENKLAQLLPVDQVKKTRSADDYPGKVGADLPRVKKEVEVDLHVPYWHSTGLYAPPGEVVTIRIPPQWAGKNLKAQVGVGDNLDKTEDLKRAPVVDRVFDLKEEKTSVASGYGGLIYILVPGKVDNLTLHGAVFWRDTSFAWVQPLVDQKTMMKVEIQGAVEAPRYVHGVTDPKDWRERIRRLEVPFAELESAKIIWTLRTHLVKDLENPDQVMAYWDAVMDHCADLAGWDRQRPAPMRFMLDKQISHGAAHAGYPIMSHEHWAFWKEPQPYDLQKIQERGTWGPIHEIGHNHQWTKGWTFQDQGEVTNDLFVLYCNEKMGVYKVKTAEKGDGNNLAWLTAREKQVETMRQKFSLQEGKAGKFPRLLFHVQLIDAFGWEPMKQVFASYLPQRQPDRFKQDQDRAGEYMVRYSRAVGRNLFLYFKGWGVEMPPGIEEKVKDLPAWLPAVWEEAKAAEKKEGRGAKDEGRG